MRIFLFCILTLTTIPSWAQTGNEWFRQKETQRKYLVQQIAALQAYAGTLQQGYAIAREGINAVQDIKNGDLGLHQAFFGSLLSVNPSILKSKNSAVILLYQASILHAFQEVLPALRQHGNLAASELNYLEKVKVTVLAACTRDMETLQMLLTEGEWKMTDDERLRQLETLYGKIRRTYQFTLAFLKNAQVLALQRSQEQNALQKIRSLFDIP